MTPEFLKGRAMGRRGMLGLALGAVMLAGLVAIGSPDPVLGNEPSETTILTVAGEVRNPNRGPYDPDNDKFFGYSDVAFKAAVAFDYDTLARLDMVSLRADFPKNGPEHLFEGPTLAAVLEAAGATGKTAVLKALDGYQIEVPVSDLLRSGAVLALKRDGKPLGIGDYGPVQLVFPRSERPELKEMSDDHWIWSVFLIELR